MITSRELVRPDRPGPIVNMSHDAKRALLVLFGFVMFGLGAGMVDAMDGETPPPVVHALPAPTASVCASFPNWDLLPAPTTDKAAAWIADACDYRKTGAHCEEDQWCAVAEILSTRNYTGQHRSA